MLEGAAAASGLFLLLLLTYLSFRRWRRHRVAVDRARTASKGERNAETLLRGLGYRILGRQVTRYWAIDVDGQSKQVQLRADLIASRSGRRFVAEVKTGHKAPKIDTPTTRRQLLEYRVAYDVDGVLLVDMTANRVHRVRFPLHPRVGRARWLVAGLLFGAAGTAAAFRFAAI